MSPEVALKAGSKLTFEIKKAHILSHTQYTDWFCAPTRLDFWHLVVMEAIVSKEPLIYISVQLTLVGPSGDYDSSVLALKMQYIYEVRISVLVNTGVLRKPATNRCGRSVMVLLLRELTVSTSWVMSCFHNSEPTTSKGNIKWYIKKQSTSFWVNIAPCLSSLQHVSWQRPLFGTTHVLLAHFHQQNKTLMYHTHHVLAMSSF